ncbi:MAG: secondary thiamine-phosphate synthase enzyme YjbQ [Candidatus Omnitrophota bacterium]
MIVVTDSIRLSTEGNTDIVDITEKVRQRLKSAGIKNGVVTVSVKGSTGAVTTCEYEPGLVQDLKEFFARLIPEGKRYHHDAAWGDGNGHAHLRASLVGPSVTIPIHNQELALGTWQQIIFIDFDNRARQRELLVQFLGEEKHVQ